MIPEPQDLFYKYPPITAYSSTRLSLHQHACSCTKGMFCYSRGGGKACEDLETFKQYIEDNDKEGTTHE